MHEEACAAPNRIDETRLLPKMYPGRQRDERVFVGG